MCEILLTNPAQGNADILKQMYAFRKKIFFDKLRWDVQDHNGLEIDYFDTLNPHYLIACQHSQQVEGCWRFLPTTGPYMLKDIFPQLLRGESAPEASQVWEISRFAVEPATEPQDDQAPAHPVTLQILQKGYEAARAHDVHQFVAVTSVAMERLLLKLGIPMQRFGDGKASRVGRVLSVACWIEVNEQYREAVYTLPRQTALQEAA